MHRWRFFFLWWRRRSFFFFVMPTDNSYCLNLTVGAPSEFYNVFSKSFHEGEDCFVHHFLSWFLLQKVSKISLKDVGTKWWSIGYRSDFWTKSWCHCSWLFKMLFLNILFLSEKSPGHCFLTCYIVLSDVFSILIWFWHCILDKWSSVCLYLCVDYMSGIQFDIWIFV